MAWRLAIGNFLRSGTMISMVGGVIVSGCYVGYTDNMRYRRMLQAYSAGNILPPLAENQYEISFLRRPDVEQELRGMISNNFANEYFLINGEVGTGKTRLVVETVRDIMKTDGALKAGAPIYVLVTQGTSFPESLAKAVKFFFDEHISYRFFLDYIMRIHSFPQRDNDSRLTRVLNAIEESSFIYMQKTGRPVVLIIDGINCLYAEMPRALEKIQDKAKLWADTNTVKVIFINNDEETEVRLQRNSSSWSRAAMPMLLADLSHSDAVKFLTTGPYLETATSDNNGETMSVEQAEAVFDVVGGRIIHLVAFKRDFVLRVPLEDTMERLKDREREKFIHVSRSPTFWVLVSALRNAPDKCYKLSKLVKEYSQQDVQCLASLNIIRYERDNIGILVKFQSPLTESVVDEFQRLYVGGH